MFDKGFFDKNKLDYQAHAVLGTDRYYNIFSEEEKFNFKYFLKGYFSSFKQYVILNCYVKTDCNYHQHYQPLEGECCGQWATILRLAGDFLMVVRLISAVQDQFLNLQN